MAVPLGGVASFFGLVIAARGLIALVDPTALAITPEGAPSDPISAAHATLWVIVGAALLASAGAVLWWAFRPRRE